MFFLILISFLLTPHNAKPKLLSLLTEDGQKYNWLWKKTSGFIDQSTGHQQMMSCLNLKPTETIRGYCHHNAMRPCTQWSGSAVGSITASHRSILTQKSPTAKRLTSMTKFLAVAQLKKPISPIRPGEGKMCSADVQVMAGSHGENILSHTGNNDSLRWGLQFGGIWDHTARLASKIEHDIPSQSIFFWHVADTLRVLQVAPWNLGTLTELLIQSYIRVTQNWWNDSREGYQGP